jgi:hypothetical protein
MLFDDGDIDARAREEQAQHEARRAGPDDDAIGLDKYLMTSLKRVSPFPA